MRGEGVHSPAGPENRIGRRPLLLGAAGLTGAAVLAPATGWAWADREGQAESAGMSGGLPGGRQAVPATALAATLRAVCARLASAGLTPPQVARVAAVLGLAVHEALPSEGRRPLLPRLGLAAPARPGGRPDPASVLAATVATVLDGMLPTPPGGVPGWVRDASASGSAAGAGPWERRARRIAATLVAWAGSDGSSRAAAPAWRPPVGPACWVPTPPAFRPALLPGWGRVRPYALRGPDDVREAPPVPFSTADGSPFRQQALEVRDALARRLGPDGDEARVIATFWDDGVGTASPGGHWLLILADLIEQRRLELDVALAAFARLGMALHDAFVACWAGKYRHCLLRPVTYLRRYVDPGWGSLLLTPNFPEHPSGHADVSHAAATVLVAVLGEGPFTSTVPLVARPVAGGDAPSMAISTVGAGAGAGPGPVRRRDFGSLASAADEAGWSRLYGGIHYARSIEAGARQGRLVGERVLAAFPL
ncbi:MAG: vanadium-dependent haloperoxidase [Motilibacteraceae bacterium]